MNNFEPYGSGGPFMDPNRQYLQYEAMLKNPSEKDLWKNEKSHYRIWIVLFGASLLILFSILISGLVLSIINENFIKDSLAKEFLGKHSTTDIYRNGNRNDITWKDHSIDKSSYQFTVYFLALPSTSIAVIGLGVIWFYISIATSYKNKSFAKISKWATFSIGLSALFGFIHLFSLVWSETSNVINNIPSWILFIIFDALAIVVWILFSIRITKIRRMFGMAARVEILRKDPKFISYMESMRSGQNPFAPNTIPGGLAPLNNDVNNENIKDEEVKKEKSKEDIKLEKLTFVQLKEIGTKLDIRGISSMKKSELIEAIKKATNS